MMNPHTSDPFGPVIVGLAILVVGPAMLTDPMIATLTATPLRRAASAFVVAVFVGVMSLWAVSRVSFRAASAVEGTQGGES
jgi:hypothetical protein